MRIIPKKIKVKNTVWKCYSMPDIIVALIMFSIIFIAITKGVWAIAVIGGLLSIVMFMPTQDGIFYFNKNNNRSMEHIDVIILLVGVLTCKFV